MSVVTDRYTFSGSGEDFGPRKGRRLVVLHTFENSDPLKNTMRDALAGAIWQDRHDVLGSYNRIVAVDGVLGCVPDDRISGGMAAGAPEYRPVAWLYDLLPAYVVNDGNSYALQLCAMGQRAYYDANGWPQEIIDGFAWSIIEEEQATGAEMVVANHADFQPGNRTDAGLALDLVMKRIPQLLALPAVESDMQFWRPVQEDWQTANGTIFYDGSGVRKNFTSVERVSSRAESSDGRYRLVRYGPGEFLVVDARGPAKEGPGLTAIPGTRVPATGYGFPPPETVITEVIKEVPTGITQDMVTAAAAQAAIAERSRIAAAEATRINAI